MNIKKSLLSLAVATVLGTTSMQSGATIYYADFSGLMTFLGPSGNPIINTSYPYYGDPTWGYGLRTPISGSLVLDDVSGTGSASIDYFDFFSSGTPVFHDIVLHATGDGAGGPGTLIIFSSLLDYKGNNNMAMELVWDAAGLYGAAPYSAGQVISGVGALPASDGILSGNYPIGPVPLATTTYDTDGSVITGNDGIGGSPYDNGPFPGFSTNFDLTSITITAVVPQVPVPAAAWLFGSGLLGLLGVAQRRKSR